MTIFGTKMVYFIIIYYETNILNKYENSDTSLRTLYKGREALMRYC